MVLQNIFLSSFRNLQVAHLDQSQTSAVNFHPYTYSQDTQDPFFTILYRPGHYDLLYR